MAFDWKKWILLSEEQYASIDRALLRAEGCSEIEEAIVHDLALLRQGAGKIGTCETKLKELYGEALYRLHPLLVLLRQMEWLADQYAAHGIPDQILLDTMSDVRIWMDVCKKHTGAEGLLEYEWLSLHFTFRLFRLGRLQFVAQESDVPAVVYRHKTSGVVTALCPDGDRYMESGEGAGLNGRAKDTCRTAHLTNDGYSVEGFPIHPCGLAILRCVKLNLSEWEKVLEPGDPVLDMHIAEGCPLDYDAVSRSLAAAPEFYEKYLKKTGFKAFTCGSWLLDDSIGQMQPRGNIARFQKRFHMVPHADSSDWQTKQRVFGDPDVNVLEAECSTTLQKAVLAWYESGRECRHAKGFILL